MGYGLEAVLLDTVTKHVVMVTSFCESKLEIRAWVVDTSRTLVGNDIWDPGEEMVVQGMRKGQAIPVKVVVSAKKKAR